MSDQKQTLFPIESEFKSITGLTPYHWMSKRRFPRKAYVRYLEHTLAVVSQQYGRLLEMVTDDEGDAIVPLDDQDLDDIPGMN